MSSDISKTQLAEAKALIQQKRYAEARKVLKRIDDPTARQWEAKLDTLAPAEKPRSAINPVVAGVGGLLAGLIIGVLIGIAIGTRPSAAPAAASLDYSKVTDVRTALVNYCGIMKLMPDCDPWVDYMLSDHLVTARTCLTTIDWERNIEPFGQCLIDKGAKLYMDATRSNGLLTATAIVATNEAVGQLLNATMTAAAPK